ncbi:lactococcin 972 family bacteriocin [Intrasporangium sp.]|uniref:lactococcin 972 family bacteriocin n=1 Tax=Intrasporangium sp. TaxID=1925024 RepID=UPI003221D501
MKKLMRAALVPFVAALALAGAAAPASAWLHLGSTTKYPVEGGTWTYGFWNAKVHSNYYHGSKCHGSTARFWNGSYWSQDRTAALAGNWSNAAVGAYNLWYTDDQYYYRTTCS